MNIYRGIKSQKKTETNRQSNATSFREPRLFFFIFSVFFLLLRPHPRSRITHLHPASIMARAEPPHFATLSHPEPGRDLGPLPTRSRRRKAGRSPVVGIREVCLTVRYPRYDLSRLSLYDDSPTVHDNKGFTILQSSVCVWDFFESHGGSVP